MASISSLLGQNMYSNASKSYASNYKAQLSNQMFGMQDLAARNDQRLLSILEKNAKLYDNNMSLISDYNEQSKSFFSDFNSKLGSLKSSSDALKTTSGSSVLNPSGYGSSNSSVVSVNSGSKYGSNDVDVNVKQIATGQTTKSQDIRSTQKGVLSGSGSINITTNDGKSTKLNFNLSSSMSAGDAMKSIAKTVNDSKLGVTASVVEKDGKSSLQFTSTSTGEDATFKATLSNNFQKALEPTVTTEAKNAVYSVNGKEFTSETNNVKVGEDNVNVTLKGAGEAKIGKNETDSSKIVDAVKAFTKDLNSAISFLKGNTNKSSAARSLVNSISSFQYRGSTFAQIGIEVNGNKMTVNEDKLKKALTDNPDRVKSLLGGSDGFAADVNKKVTAALQRQTQFMPPPQISTGSSSNYFGNYSPYSGTLFDILA